MRSDWKEKRREASGRKSLFSPLFEKAKSVTATPQSYRILKIWNKNFRILLRCNRLGFF